MDFDAHRNSQTLDLQEVSKFLEEEGFTNINLKQQWRHITGSVTKNGIKQFLKLASTEGIAERTKNEFAWNNLINNDLTLNLPISIPKNYESGEYKGLFWFTCEFIEGAPLAIASEKDKVEVLATYLSDVVLTAKSIIELKSNNKLPNDTRKTEEKEDPQKVFLERLKHWVGQIDSETNELLNFIEKRMEFWQESPSHGDFVPWHIFIIDNKKLYLIDGEHSRIRGFKFYDIAYFYHRAYTKLKNPDIADRFLREFNNIYKFNEADKECFKLILAQRVIGGYFDAKSDGETSIELQDELKDKILKDKITLN